MWGVAGRKRRGSPGVGRAEGCARDVWCGPCPDCGRRDPCVCVRCLIFFHSRLFSIRYCRRATHPQPCDSRQRHTTRQPTHPPAPKVRGHRNPRRKRNAMHLADDSPRRIDRSLSERLAERGIALVHWVHVQIPIGVKFEAVARGLDVDVLAGVAVGRVRVALRVAILRGRHVAA